MFSRNTSFAIITNYEYFLAVHRMKTPENELDVIDFSRLVAASEFASVYELSTSPLALFLGFTLMALEATSLISVDTSVTVPTAPQEVESTRQWSISQLASGLCDAATSLGSSWSAQEHLRVASAGDQGHSDVSTLT